jgi:hypothetical protein
VSAGPHVEATPRLVQQSVPARERAKLARSEIARLLDEARRGRGDLVANAEDIRRAAQGLWAVELCVADELTALQGTGS